MGSFLTIILLQLARLALSSPIETKAIAACDLPSWNVTNLEVKYGADVQTGGRATWTFTNSLTNVSDALSCSLRANSRCEIVGTPSDKGTHIFLQISIDTVYWTVNQTWKCDSNPATFIIGVGETSLVCPDEYSKTMTCTTKFGTIKSELPTL